MIPILLIHPSRKILNKKDILFTKESLVPSIGLASLAAFSLKNYIEPRIIDLRLPIYSIRDVLDYIASNKPVLVGFIAFTTEIGYANETARIIKEKYPQLTILVGGPHASLLPEQTLNEFKNFDIAVIGEGEQTLVKLATLIAKNTYDEIGRVPGIAYRLNGTVRVNDRSGLIEDLDKLPFPAWHLFDLKRYNNIFPVSASRGCPYSCYFCTPLYLGNKVRSRSYNSIVAEIKYLVDNFNAKRIQFSDAIMGLRNEDMTQLCDELIKTGLSKKIVWDCETRADSVNINLLQKMKQAGCEWVALGVESGNERILKEIVNKAETKEQIKNAVSLIKKAGLKARCFFILGHCTETVETVKDTVRFALELNPDALSFGLMVPNPGSGIRKLAEKGVGGLKIMHNRWEDYQQFDYSCMESEGLTLKELKKWQSNAYFTFYLHNPAKALQMLFNESAYNYNLGSIAKIVKMLIINKFKTNE